MDEGTAWDESGAASSTLVRRVAQAHTRMLPPSGAQTGCEPCLFKGAAATRELYVSEKSSMDVIVPIERE